ncbi:hypothetical protein [Thermophilibacter provencensis]|uniref:DUF5134 domain-containing protein n=1 Tax=Thermophilibacter provencensis TaxID=1852386 RepID=A0ABT7V0U2_9ACTN|nr:hypothetical protein [Thermophilibacter provencensis]MDM8270222.1 hypothetical protein [Thermophilibacter provencensis]
MEGFIGVAIAGVTALLGVYMIVTGDCRLLHGYHYATTPESERPLLARETGVWMVVLAVAIALMIPSALPDWATVVGVTLLVVGIAGTLVTIARHNGGLVTSAAGAGLGGLGPRASMAVCAAVGALLSLMGLVPGAYMIATGDVSLLHGYHYANVAPADVPALATGEGLAMVGLGASILMFMIGIGGQSVLRPVPRWAKALMVAGGALFAASLVAMLLLIIHFNGSLMGA